MGLVLPAPTVFNTIVSNWANQTYNAVTNYGNRNASSKYTTKDVIKSYFYAAVTSCIVALGIRKLVEHKTKSMTGGPMFMFNAVSASAACAIAGFLNAWFMRQTELKQGIDVVNPDDPSEVVGKSKAAGKKAVLETAISRIWLAVPMIFPSIALFLIEDYGYMPKNFFAQLALQLVLFFIFICVAVPFSLAIFP